MQRAITGFGQDAENDWFATLSCGHAQHVRHRPPFFDRPWVISEDGRNARLGTTLDCVRCDRFEWPGSACFHRHTPVFTNAAIPAGLLKDHATKAGTWARIEVAEGRLLYIVDSLGYERELTPGRRGIVVPEMRHRVQPIGDVTFFLEMFRIS